MSEALVTMEGIEKSFPGVHALADCQFDLYPGEVHALVGENGAGKSTLMKVLAGVYSKDAGQVFVKGRKVDIPNPRAAQDLGISMIHQELNLMPHLTVAQNIFIGREPRSALNFFLDEKAINLQTQDLLETLHLKLNPRARVSSLTVAKQQMVEIAKALSLNAEVLIMDEPTAALTQAEIQELFRIIRQMRAKGVGIVYISHRLEELKQISDRITVMRDGRYIDTVPTPDASIDQIISMMVGRTIYEASPEIPDNGHSDVMLEVRNLNRGRVLQGINFSVKRGEIVGFAGLMGAGRTEVARAIFGADRMTSGKLILSGKQKSIPSSRAAVSSGIGLVPEDRKNHGVILGMKVRENVTMPSINKVTTLLGVIRARTERGIVADLIDKLSIKTSGMDAAVADLSGGNQQKVALAKWLSKTCDLLILDEPTRGVDVGAKVEIYNLINDLAAQGIAIIMISSEMMEMIGMADRVMVMSEGKVTGFLEGEEVTEENILRLSMPGTNRVYQEAV